MSLKKLLILTACVALVAAAVSCKKQNKETVKIGAIFSVTGAGFIPGRTRREDRKNARRANQCRRGCQREEP